MNMLSRKMFYRMSEVCQYQGLSTDCAPSFSWRKDRFILLDQGTVFFFFLFNPELYFFVSCSLSVSFELFNQNFFFQKYSFITALLYLQQYLLSCNLLFAVYQFVIYPIIVSDQDRCGRTRDMVLFITHILHQCLNVVPTLPTMQFDHLQCSQRFGRVSPSWKVVNILI